MDRIGLPALLKRAAADAPRYACLGFVHDQIFYLCGQLLRVCYRQVLQPPNFFLIHGNHQD